MLLAKMAVIHLSLLATIWFFISPAAAEQNCSIVRCKVLPVGESIASEFKPKASEEGVRMIYLNLKIGNNSYNPLELQDEFQPDRWVWARSNKEPMLSLPYDFDILSLGLLNYQVGSMTVPLKDEPSGCLAGLNSTCQNLVVGRALLSNVTSKSGNNGVVCVAMIDEDVHNSDDTRPIVYHCCRLNASSINCDLSVEARMSLEVINTFLFLLSFVVMFYSPAILLMLPEDIFDLQYECDKESNNEKNELLEVQNGEEERLRSFDTEEIPVDDSSPITCSVFLLEHFQRLPNLTLSFNFKLVFLLFFVLPFGFYIKLGLYFLLKQKYFNEYVLKFPDQEVSSLFSLPSAFFFFYPFYFSGYSILTLTPLILTCLMAVLFLRPKDLFLNRQPTKCCLCAVAAYSFTCATENESSVSIGENILQHLKLIPKEAHHLTLRFLKYNNSGLKKLVTFSTCFLKVDHNGSRMKRVLCMLWLLSSSLVTLFLAGILWGIFCLTLLFDLLVIILFLFSPVILLVKFSVDKIMTKINAITSNSRVVKVIFYLVTIPYMILLLLGFFLLLSLLCNLFLGTFAFTIMGLVLNVEIVTPYVAFFVVVTTNIYFCYANLQKGYVEVKGFILKYWQQELQTIRSSEQRTIPAKLFWFVSDRVLPIQNEICLMLRNTAFVVTFLFLTISSIIFFGHEYEISTLVSTVAVFISGAIPSLFFKGLTRGKKFAGWEKIKLKREIEAVVREYLEYSVNRETEERSSSRNDGDMVLSNLSQAAEGQV